MDAFSLPDLLGAVGVTLIIVTYLLLQLERLRSASVAYSLLNGIGALLILFSLLFKFNLPAFLVEIFWFLVSILGLVKSFCARRREVGTALQGSRR